MRERERHCNKEIQKRERERMQSEGGREECQNREENEMRETGQKRREVIEGDKPTNGIHGERSNRRVDKKIKEGIKRIACMAKCMKYLEGE